MPIGKIQSAGRSRAMVSRRVVLPIALLLVAPASDAQRWARELSIDSIVTVSDNANLAGEEDKQDDVIAQISPRFSFRGEGSRVFVSGAGDLTYLWYTQGTARSGFRPQGNVLGRLEAIERLFFIEAAATAAQTVENPFGARPGQTWTVNTDTVAQYRLSPYLTGRLSDTMHLSVRSDNTWTQTTGDLSDDAQAYGLLNAAELVRDARPLGFNMRLEQKETRFESASVPRQTEESVRVSLRYAVLENLVLGARGGRERNNYFRRTTEESIEGVDFSWRPTQRTDLTGFWERRFFGDSWQLGFTHRNPRVAWNLQLSRTVTSAPLSLFTLPASADVAGLLDSLLTTRFPDPTERLRAVQDLMSRQGLPNQLVAPFVLLSQQVNLYNSKSASIAYSGVQTALALRIYELRTEALGDDPVGTFLIPTVDSRQRGVGLTLTRRVAEFFSVAAEATWTHVVGLGPDAGPDSKQRTYRLQANRQLSAKTSAYVGARRDSLDSNAVPAFRETAVYLGLGHRF
jgi:uncharacterized protein (PEP-CTERM system associated)